MMLKKTAVLLLIGIVFVLPLYELADYAEQFAHDSELVLMALCLFFMGGLVLISRQLICASFRLSKAECAAPVLRPIENSTPHEAARSESVLFLRFCDIRI